MSIETVLIWALAGVASGWLTHMMVQKEGSGLLGDIGVGLAGAMLGGVILFYYLGAGFIPVISAALCGAAVLLLGVRIVKEA
jgi:uncharacterized membrane protein YeaQ/YmgE (transglycosylase-associated protein family)